MSLCRFREFGQDLPIFTNRIGQYIFTFSLTLEWISLKRIIIFIFLREIDLRECYHLAPSTFQSFFVRFLFPGKVTVFDLSHCYWIPAKMLLKAVRGLPNVEKLFIEDTCLNFTHLPKIFKKCHKISHLSFTLKLSDVKKCFASMFHVDNISGLVACNDSFKRLTHLKIVWHDSEVLSCLIVLEILT